MYKIKDSWKTALSVTFKQHVIEYMRLVRSRSL